jgi:hypothetical protein
MAQFYPEHHPPKSARDLICGAFARMATDAAIPVTVLSFAGKCGGFRQGRLALRALIVTNTADSLARRASHSRNVRFNASSIKRLLP